MAMAYKLCTYRPINYTLVSMTSIVHVSAKYFSEDKIPGSNDFEYLQGSPWTHFKCPQTFCLQCQFMDNHNNPP